VIHETPDRNGTTELTGVLQDQAALFGVLDQLYCMGAPLLSIERLESAGDPGEGGQPRRG